MRLVSAIHAAIVVGGVVFLFGAFGISIDVFSALAEEAPPTVVHAARWFDGDKVVQGAWVSVEHGKITRVASTAPAPAPAKVVELGDVTLLPGLVDVHVHLLLPETYDASAGRMTMLSESSAAKALRGLDAAQRTMSAGFTTIRDPGDFDTHRAHLDVRDAIDAGTFPGPRILAADRFITRTGGHYDDNWVASDEHVVPWARVANGPAQIIEAVREEAKAGADWIKVAASGGEITPRSAPELATFDDAEMRALVTEAHRLHKKVAAHAHSQAAIESSIRAGVDSIEHGTDATAAQLREMAQKHIYFVPTWYYNFTPGDHDAWLVSWRKEKRQDNTTQMKAALAARTPIALGTDSGVHHHGENARQLTMFVETGMKPVEALRTATVNAASLLGLDDVGRIGKGFVADLVAVPGNPLTDMRVMESVRFVMRAGRVVKGP